MAASAYPVVNRQELPKRLVAQAIGVEPAIDARIPTARHRSLARDLRPAQAIGEGLGSAAIASPTSFRSTERLAQRAIGGALEDAVFAFAAMEDFDDWPSLLS